jgi:hypothetical protein
LHKGKSTLSAAGKQWASGVIAEVVRWGDNVMTMGGMNAVN